jgi:formylglycine-generating enzyme required for sulfatase activity
LQFVPSDQLLHAALQTSNLGKIGKSSIFNRFASRVFSKFSALLNLRGDAILLSMVLKFFTFMMLGVLLEIAFPFPAGATEMIRIPAGPFTMGSNTGPEDERPAHNVTLAAFDIDAFPITNADFAKFLTALDLRNARGEKRYDEDDNDARIHRVNDRWRADLGYENHPVVEPSWVGARDYCVWLGKNLPTEAQWEKAARGTDARPYPWGTDLPNENRARFSAGYNQTTRVDAFPDGRSAYGVWSMAGNAWEWVSSAYRPYPYRSDDGRENMEAGPVRSTRGGGHDSPATEITTTQRGRNLSRAPRAGHHNISFRCVRDERSK